MQQVGLQSLPWELHREILSWLPLVPDRLGSCARINKLWNKNAHEFLEELDLSPYVDNLSDSIIVYLSSKCTKLHTLKIYSINYPKIDSFFGRDDLSLYRHITDKGIQAMVSNLLTHSIELHHLSLAGCCSLTARSFHAISQLPLLSLDLSYCFQLQDDDLLALIKEESHLFALQELHIRGCRHLTPRSLIPLFDRLTQLRTLDLLFVWQIDEEALSHLGQNLVSLKSLNLNEAGSKCTGYDKHLSNLTGLQELHLSFVDNVTDEVVVRLVPHLTNLTSLSLSDTGLSDTALDAIAQYLLNMRKLNVSRNAKVTDAGVVRLREALTQLESLDLEGCIKVSLAGEQYFRNFLMLGPQRTSPLYT